MIRIFRHYVPTALLMLAVIEAVLLVGTMYLAVALRFMEPHTIETVGPIWPKALIFAVVMVLIMTSLGLYQRELDEGDWAYYGRFFLSFVVGFIGMAWIFYALPQLFLGRGALTLAFVAGFFVTAAARLIFLKFVDHEAIKRRVLVIGTGTRAARIEMLEKSRGVSGRFRVVGYLPANATQHHVPPGKVLKEKGVCLPDLVRKYQVDEVVVGVRDRRNGGMPVQEVLDCKLAGVSVVDLSTFFERETGHVQLDSLNSSWMIFSDGFHLTSSRETIKRAFDIIVSAMLLGITAPVMLVTAVLVAVESRGPILYRQERVGQYGQVFNVLKFRSMRADAEKGGVPQWATSNDNRVTRVGRVIRKLRIDELPQILNVLRGDMSFVGPRPERPYFVEQLSADIRYYSCRHSVKPGITGWAQVRYPYGASLEDAIQKLQYDLYYVKNHSLFLDALILIETVQVVLFGKGAR